MPDPLEPAWVSAAAAFEPVEESPRQALPSPDARGALAVAILGVLFFGFVLGPIALVLARRAEFARLDQGALDLGHAGPAISLGKVGFALHLCVALAALPWALFVLPMLASP